MVHRPLSSPADAQAESELLEFCRHKGIVCVAWSPLAKFSRRLMGAPCIASTATRHGVSAAQVVLRWNVQRGVARCVCRPLVPCDGRLRRPLVI